MPELDGLEFCRRVRVTERHRHVHFIMLTVHAGKEELSRAFDAGVDDFLAKPFNEAELMAALALRPARVALYDELPGQHHGFAAAQRTTDEPQSATGEPGDHR